MTHPDRDTSQPTAPHPATSEQPAVSQQLGTSNSASTPTITGDVIPFGQAAKAWFLISLQTFGGPAGQIAVMQRTLVDENRWIGHRRFLHALTTACCCPAPKPNSWPSTPAGCSTVSVAA